jgi:hypothetical protein
MGLELGSINLQEAMEIEKRRGKRLAELSTGSVRSDESPFSKENMDKNSHTVRVKMRGRQRFDIQNIGAGTRCLDCGLLHFCWTPACAGCGGAMDYNKGSHHEQ